jgi:iron complex outermembrane recepter protein
MKQSAPAHAARHTSCIKPLALCVAMVIPALASAQEAATVLPEVKVTAGQESAWGPVDGYVAKRSATATKTDTKLSETPQAVTVVTRDQMIDQGATTIQDALGYAAGVRSDAYGLDSRTDSARVRGANPDEYIDGIRKNFNWYTSSVRTEPYTLERLEVLRGAAAMLYGQGTTGGLVNMVSKRPLAEAQNEIGVQYGSWSRKQIQADLTGPVDKNGEFLYRLVVVKRDADTQVDHVRDDRTVVAPSLTWRPSAATSLTLQALVQSDKSGSTAQFFPWSGVATANPNGKLPTSRFIGDPNNDRYNTNRTTLGWLLEHQLNDSWKVRQNARYTSNSVDYRSAYGDSFTVAGGWAGDPAGQRMFGRFADATQTKVRSFGIDQNIEGSVQTGRVTHKILAGLDYNRSETKIRGSLNCPVYYPVGTPGCDATTAPLIDAYNPDYDAAAIDWLPLNDRPTNVVRQTGTYIQDQMKIDRWIFMAGLRHDRASNATHGSATEKSSANSKRFGLMYLTPIGLSPYLSYSESFTPVPNSAFGQTFEPLRGEQWEAGIKFEPVGSRMSYNASVYEWKEKNQLREAVPGRYNQLGQTSAKGIELEARGELFRNFDVIAHYNYIDLDEKLEAVPHGQAALWGKYRFAVGGMPGFSAGAGARYMSSFTDGAAPATDAVTLFDAMLAWDSAKWRIALNVSNLTDKTYVATCLSRGDCWYGARRNAILSATYRW